MKNIVQEVYHEDRDAEIERAFDQNDLAEGRKVCVDYVKTREHVRFCGALLFCQNEGPLILLQNSKSSNHR